MRRMRAAKQRLARMAARILVLMLPQLVAFSDRIFSTEQLLRFMPKLYIWLGITGVFGVINGLLGIYWGIFNRRVKKSSVKITFVENDRKGFSMTHLYLIRHADSIEGLSEGKYQDLGLSPEGIRQAELLRDRLAATSELNVDMFISSPYRRAQETANILSSVFEQPLLLDEEVVEWRGDDGTLSPDEFTRRWQEVPKSQKAYFRWMEGYENRLEFTLRVHLALNRITQEHKGKTIVVVTHGAFIQLSFNHFFGFGEANMDYAAAEIRKTSLTHWYQPENQERWLLERSNDYYHLNME
jgi:2,3-bisphosphoglycerate-dependent phosphoglycerate mutase